MIDVRTEKLVPLSDVPALPCVPTSKGGKPVAVNTIYNWYRRGCRGVRLEVVPRGHTLFTSVEAIQRFYERLAEPRCARTPSEALKSFASAQATLVAAGF